MSTVIRFIGPAADYLASVEAHWTNLGLGTPPLVAADLTANGSHKSAESRKDGQRVTLFEFLTGAGEPIINIEIDGGDEKLTADRLSPPLASAETMAHQATRGVLTLPVKDGIAAVRPKTPNFGIGGAYDPPPAAEEPDAPVPPDWVQPKGAHDAYAVGAIVQHHESRWVSLTSANVWEPGVSGWREVVEAEQLSERIGSKRTIDTGWHPLAAGLPPPWASEWGQDEHGVFVGFTIADVTQRLRWIPPGRYVMGSPEDEPGRFTDEGPQHSVTIGGGFWLFDTPVTQPLWTAVMGDNPSRFQSPERPVEQVSWDDVQGFLERLNRHVSGLDLALPSEAQWEYACRAGTATALWTGPLEIVGENNTPALDPIAWYGGNSGEGFELEDGYGSSDWPEKQYPHSKAGTRSVGLKGANPWGLSDMLGNVWEWCADDWHESYDGAPTDGSAWVGASSESGERGRVFRGGSWSDRARGVRAACRGRGVQGYRVVSLGFRCARGQL